MKISLHGKSIKIQTSKMKNKVHPNLHHSINLQKFSSILKVSLENQNLKR